MMTKVKIIALVFSSLLSFIGVNWTDQTLDARTIPASSENVTMSTLSKNMNSPLQIECSLEPATADGNLIFCYRLKNVWNETVHVFDSERMPYLMLLENGELLVLHGVNAPDPDVDYNVIEIPVTKALEPGAVLDFKVDLNPLFLRNHFEKSVKPTALTGKITVQCHVAWGSTPIEPSDRHKRSLQFLLDWQTMATGNPVEVTFP